MESEPPYQYVRGNVVNLTDPSGKVPPLPILPPDTAPEDFYRAGVSAGVEFWRAAYDKRNPLWRCSSGDDGRHPSDRAYDFMRDFVCEWGETESYFNSSHQLTKDFMNSSSVAILRKKVYEGEVEFGVEKSYRFSIPQFFDATIDLPWDFGITHVIGSYVYKIDRDGPWLQFAIKNPINRKSGSRIPGRYEGEAAEDILDAPDIKNMTIQSFLRYKTREETVDPEGGGAMMMYFNWRELYNECHNNKYSPYLRPYPGLKIPSHPS